MKWTPMLIVYLVLLVMMIFMVRELNKCTENLRKQRIHILPVE